MVCMEWSESSCIAFWKLGEHQCKIFPVKSRTSYLVSLLLFNLCQLVAVEVSYWLILWEQQTEEHVQGPAGILSCLFQLYRYIAIDLPRQVTSLDIGKNRISSTVSTIQRKHHPSLSTLHIRYKTLYKPVSAVRLQQTSPSICDHLRSEPEQKIAEYDRDAFVDP